MRNIATEVPDPLEASTFRSAVLDWDALRRNAAAKSGWRWCANCSRSAGSEIVPRLAGAAFGEAQAADSGLLTAHWRMGDGATLQLTANLSESQISGAPGAANRRPIWGDDTGATMAPWSVLWHLGAR